MVGFKLGAGKVIIVTSIMKKQFLILLFSFLLLTKYSFGENLTKDNLLKMSPSQIIILANNGDALAQLWLGDAIYNGSIPNWRNFSGCEWYYKSAKQNNAEAALKLYKYYLNFRVDSKDCPKIIGIEKPNLDKNYWLLKAARLNNPEAQLILFDDEISSEDNDRKKIALRWLNRAAKNNYPPALNQLAHLHKGGAHVKKDVGKAIELYTKASNLDSKNETPDRILAEIYSNEFYLNGTTNAKFQFQQGKKNKAKYEADLRFYESYNYTNYFDIKKAVSSAEKCIQKAFEFSCYMKIINYYSEKKFNNIDYEEALMWLNEAEEVLKKSDFYSTILTTKGWAYLQWDNLKVNKTKAREYFQKAISSHKKSRFPSKERIKLYEKWISYTY